MLLSQPINLLSREGLQLLYSLASEAYESKKYTIAKDLFAKLTQHAPHISDYWFGLGSTYMQLTQYKTASECFAFAIAMEPSDPFAYLHAAESLYLSGNKTGAIQVLKECRKIALEGETRDFQLIAQIESIQKKWKGGAL